MKKGLIKGVISGDCVIISGKLMPNNDLPKETVLYLTGISAPRLGNHNKLEDEPCGFESREFVRKLINGKIAKYQIDYVYKDKNYGQIEFESKNIGLELVKNGLAKIGFIPKDKKNILESSYFKELQEYEQKSKDKKLGIFSPDADEKKRKLIDLVDIANTDSSLISSILSNKSLPVIVERVLNCAQYILYIPSFSLLARFSLRFVAVPTSRDPQLFAAGKAYAERISLCHDSIIRFLSLDDRNGLVGDLENAKNQDVGKKIVEEGYAKVFGGKDKEKTGEDEKRLADMRNYEAEAKEKRLRIWNSLPVPTVSKTLIDSNEIGPAIFLYPNSGDSITILPNNSKNNKKTKDTDTNNILDSIETRIFLSNIKAPSLAKYLSDENDQPWAFQAKEFIRKFCLGKELECIFDYIKKPKNTITNVGEKEKPIMKFYTVYVKDKDELKCLNTSLVQAGLASVISPSQNDEGKPSAQLAELRNAENTARDNNIGIHSKNSPPSANYSDLVSANRTKKKEFVGFLKGLTEKKAVVEFCFGPSKFKVRIPNKHCYVLFNLIGIKTFNKDKNNSDLINKYFKEAINYVYLNALQRDCICDIISADKIGNYFGDIIIDGKNLATELLSKGYAVLNEQNENEKKKITYYTEMENAEASAKKQKLGIWKEPSLVNLLKFGGNIEENEEEKDFEEINKEVKVRITEEIDMANFFCNFLPNNSLKTIEQTLEKYSSGEKKITNLSEPVKNGTLCAARYPDDYKYYRAIIRGYDKKDNQYKVEFFDYGNIEYVSIKDLIKLDSTISTFPSQVVMCEMAYLKYSKRSMKTAVDKIHDFIDFDNQLNAIHLYNSSYSGTSKRGLIIFRDGKDPHSSFHAQILSSGFAKLDENAKFDPEILKVLKEEQEKAKKGKIGIWADNEVEDYDEEE